MIFSSCQFFEDLICCDRAGDSLVQLAKNPIGYWLFLVGPNGMQTPMMISMTRC